METVLKTMPVCLRETTTTLKFVVGYGYGLRALRNLVAGLTDSRETLSKQTKKGGGTFCSSTLFYIPYLVIYSWHLPLRKCSPN